MASTIQAYCDALGALCFSMTHQGKVRDMYEISAQHPSNCQHGVDPQDIFMMVATDRISAFDVVLADHIPEKGKILNQISLFWGKRLAHIIPNHFTDRLLSDIVNDSQQQISPENSVLVRKLEPLPIEAIARGYLFGSAWKEYQETGNVCGVTLPKGLRQAEKLPEAIFTPSTKADVGAHDQNISFADMCDLLGTARAEEVRDYTLRLYSEAADYAYTRGLIIADTKFEFGVDRDKRLFLIDEILTPDSSRFWSLQDYQIGTSPKSFDKQYVRDYLEKLAWNKQGTPPRLPQKVIDNTRKKYLEAQAMLMG